MLVNAQGNKFTVKCDGGAPPEQLAYLSQAGHLCPQTPAPAALTTVDEETVDTEATAATTNGTQCASSWPCTSKTICQHFVWS